MIPAALNLVVLRSADMERAASFYRLLGLEFTLHRHGKGPEHFASEAGGIVFEIYPLSPDGPPTSGTRVGFTVASLDEILAAVRDFPAETVSPAADSPWDRRAVVADPDSHRVELVQRASA